MDYLPMFLGDVIRYAVQRVNHAEGKLGLWGKVALFMIEHLPEHGIHRAAVHA
jgi:hypothetical protein